MNATEFQRFRERLLDLRDRLRDEIRASIETVAADIRPVGEDTYEPSEGLDKELLVERNAEELYHAVNAALKRLDQGRFGRCGECGRAIPDERLEAIPYAEYCMDCERRFEQRR